VNDRIIKNEEKEPCDVGSIHVVQVTGRRDTAVDVIMITNLWAL
jgi:hypothetical protein